MLRLRRRPGPPWSLSPRPPSSGSRTAASTRSRAWGGGGTCAPVCMVVYIPGWARAGTRRSARGSRQRARPRTRLQFPRAPPPYLEVCISTYGARRYAAEKCLETLGAGSYFLMGTFLSYGLNLGIVAAVLCAAGAGWAAYQCSGFDHAPRRAAAPPASSPAHAAASAPAAAAAATGVAAGAVAVSVAASPTLLGSTPVAPVRHGWIELA